VIKIPVVYREVTESDESGVQIVKQIGEPQTPIPSNAARVECDGEFYTVYEQAD